MRQTVILAAGNGRRINGASGGVPKPLVQVSKRPLIEHALWQAIDAGCEEAIVVLGNYADVIRAHLDQLELPITIRPVYNKSPDRPNGVSLLAAEPYTDDRFFLQMADHVFTRAVLTDLSDAAEADPGPVRLLVDFEPGHFDEPDATKVLVENQRITNIGKEVDPWDGIDAGYFLLDRRVFTALRAAERVEDPSVSSGMKRLAAQGALAPVAMREIAWVDVDTGDDLAQAESIIGQGVVVSAAR